MPSPPTSNRSIHLEDLPEQIPEFSLEGLEDDGVEVEENGDDFFNDEDEEKINKFLMDEEEENNRRRKVEGDGFEEEGFIDNDDNNCKIENSFNNIPAPNIVIKEGSYKNNEMNSIDQETLKDVDSNFKINKNNFLLPPM